MRKEHPSRPVRAASAAAVAAMLAAALAGCSSSGSQSSSNPLPSSSAAVSGTPGSLSVVAPNIHLVVTDAKLRPTANGGSALSMTVRNTGTAPEHLTSAHGPGGWATLSGTQVSAAGILLPMGSSVAIGGTNEPQITFTGAPGAAAGGSTQLTLLFALAGEVRLTAVVTH